MADRVTQKVVEAVYTGSPNVRATQRVVEAIYLPSTRNVRVSQRVVEVVYRETTTLIKEPEFMFGTDTGGW